jgi:hypothetical protein
MSRRDHTGGVGALISSASNSHVVSRASEPNAPIAHQVVEDGLY